MIDERVVNLYCVVEGHGETKAVGVLIRRIADHSGLEQPTKVLHSRVARHALLRPDELEQTLRFARLRVGGEGRVLVLIDADDDCPRDLALELCDRVRRATNLVTAVVIANREFEAWFLAAAESLRGARGLSPLVEAPEDPEAVRDAKGWLTDQMEHGHSYSPPVDQPALAALMDLDRARSSRSFDKCYREIIRLLSRQ